MHVKKLGLTSNVSLRTVDKEGKRENGPTEGLLKLIHSDFYWIQITILTPAIFHMALKYGRIEGLHLVTMMIFDECHHTHGENIYNKIMGRYVDNKVLLQRGALNIPPRLPQVMD